jgi:hypothetical protein
MRLDGLDYVNTPGWLNPKRNESFSGSLLKNSLGNRADSPLRKLPLRSGSQWLQWSPRVFSEFAPSLTSCPITFLARPIPGGYTDSVCSVVVESLFTKRNAPNHETEILHIAVTQRAKVPFALLTDARLRICGGRTSRIDWLIWNRHLFS